MGFTLVEVPSGRIKTPDQKQRYRMVEPPAEPPKVNRNAKTSRERSWGEIGKDVGLSAAQGFQSGFQGLLGMPGDLQNLAGNVAGWGAGKLGYDPATQQSVRDVARRVPTLGLPVDLPTTEDVNKTFESVIGKYTPQTDWGRYARPVGEFAPAAMTGPGGVLRKTAMAVIPGLATEAAGDLTNQNPYAKAIAGIGTAVLTAGRGGAPGTKRLLNHVGDADAKYAQVKGKADQLYTALRNAGVKYDANEVDRAIADASAMRINPALAPKAVGLREELAQFQGKGMDFQDLDELERIATGLLRDNLESTDRKFVNDILTKIRNVRENGVVATNGSIPANEVNAVIGQAKDYGRRKILADNINEMKRRLPGYLSGDESAYRNQFGAYIKSPESSGLSKAEKKAFGNVVRREGPLNLAHNMGSRVGQIAGGSAGSVAGGLLGSSAGPAGTIAGAMAGAATNMAAQSLFRKFMDVYTERGVENAMKTVLAGRTAQEKAAVQDMFAKWQAGASAALASDAALRNGNQNWFLQDANGRTYPVPVSTK